MNGVYSLSVIFSSLTSELFSRLLVLRGIGKIDRVAVALLRILPRLIFLLMECDVDYVWEVNGFTLQVR